VFALALPAKAQFSGGVAAGFTSGSQYSFRPLDPYWNYYGMPPPLSPYSRLNASPIFMTSINFPGVYGAYTPGVTPTSYYDRSPLFTPDAAPAGFSTLSPREGTFAALAANPRTAVLEVHVPSADAELRFDAGLTALTGSTRQFVTPPLLPGGNYVYNVQVTWTADGVQRTRDRSVYVQAGDRLVVDLSTARGNSEGTSLRVLPPPQSSSTLRTRPMP
jgi:uncharacterized protein (TIGR03000 family)